ncbi:MAG: hypothetical protein IKO36_09355 [Bacteroidaceae bacterium]|nr:hypothetical protein [Bacteroidaceae bacterium]
MNYYIYGYYDDEPTPYAREIECVHTIGLARWVAKKTIREKHCTMVEVIRVINPRQPATTVFVLCKKMRR